MLNVPTLYHPVLETVPKVLKVGPVAVGECGTGNITLTNFDGCHLHILGVRLSHITEPGFGLSPLPALPFLVPSEESVTLEVLFCPTRKGCASGSVEILSDDPMRPLVSVALYGMGA